MTDAESSAASTRRRRAHGLLILTPLLLVLAVVLSRLFFGTTVVRDEVRLLTPTSYESLGLPVENEPPTLAFSAPPARNLIVVMVDGLGFNHVAAARLALKDHAARLSFERLPITGWHYPFPARGLGTDSAASATAIATGVPTTNGAVATDVDGQAVTTLLEYAQRLGKKTGIVTDSYIWDATPGAFGSHAPDRNDARQLLQGFADSSLDVLFGELKSVKPGSKQWQAQISVLQQRFVVAESADQLEAIAEQPKPIAAALPEDQIEDSTSHPNLRRLTEIALRRLSPSPNGFVLMVESEEPDSASHQRDYDRLVAGMESLEQTMQVILDFATADSRTLVVVTADHETGGLTLHPARANKSARIRWGSDDHTVSPVPIYAGGPGALPFTGVHHNSELFAAFLKALGEFPPPSMQPLTEP